MPFRSVLAPLDLSPLTDRVLGRVAKLPFAERARVTLLHVVPDTLDLGLRRRAVRDAKEAMAQARAQLLEVVPRGVTVVATVSVGAAPGCIAESAESAGADLVVMGRGSPHGIRDIFLGSTAERVIRKTAVPILAVRNPARAPYRRPMIAVDLDEGAPEVIAALRTLIATPQPPVSVIHAYDIPSGGVRYPHLSEEDYAELREHYREIASRGMKALLHAQVPADERGNWHLRTPFGNPRAMVMKAVTQHHADLLALATHGYRGLAHAFLGTVAGDLLRRVPCDVLVVPPRGP